MCFFFGRKARLKRIRKRIQADCTHEWVIVSEYTMFDGYKQREMRDLYCPLCEVEKEKVCEIDAEKYINIVKERKKYEENHHYT